ncbi:aldehyde dehydrogenase family protein [Mesorhizobium sp. WSM3224]|uniref:aldehyde dehydrogenase family protein n=1 Tax=Mesorhizobium sp. WSM3224 TaxID=1040986 RepID=UPI001FD9AF34|nr:aldehyde dehydrogenase family protein [Mesorhizobium sp. WSM3224]
MRDDLRLLCRQFSKIHAPEMIEARPPKRSVVFQPLGVILAVMPWNFPFWQVFRFAAPALMAGNASILKHSSNDPGCALAIEEVFREAGFPEHLFRTLMVGSSAVDSTVEDPRIRAVTLTGSGPAGRAVARRASGHRRNRRRLRVRQRYCPIGPQAPLRWR